MTAPARTAVTQRPQQGAVQTTEPAEKKHPIVELLEHPVSRARIEPFLPKGIDLARVAAAVIMACKKNPDLMNCTGESIVMAVAKIHSWGLEVGDEAYLVPFGKVATPIAGYTGLARLMITSGAVRAVDTFCVYANEHFDYVEGAEPRLEHRPATMAKDRGELIGAYVRVRLPHQLYKILYMPLEEIDAIRLRYSKSWKQGACPPWYAKKTTVRQVAKLLPKDARLLDVFRVIEDEERLELQAALQLPSGEVGAVDRDEPPLTRTFLPPESEEEGAAIARQQDLDAERGDGEPDHEHDEMPDELPLGQSARPAKRNAVAEGR